MVQWKYLVGGIIVGLVIGIVVGFGVANWLAKPVPPSPPPTPIVIGHQADLTGSLAFWGAWHDRAARAAIDYINKHGGIAGRPVVYVVEDTKSSVPDGITALERLVLVDHADFIIGSVHSGIGIACAPKAAELGVIYTPRGHATQITADALSRYTFRIMTSVKSEVQAMANIIKKENLIEKEFGRNWTVIYVDYSFGWDYRDQLRAVAKDLGINIIAEIAVPVGTLDFMPYLTKIPPETTTIFYLMVGPTQSEIMNKQLYELGWTRVPRITSIASLEGINVDALANVFEGTWVHELMPKNAKKFDTPYYKAFREALGVDDYFRDLKDPTNHGTAKTLTVWESIFMLKKAIEETEWKDKSDNPKLIKYLENAVFNESFEFPQGTKFIRAEDHQMFTRTWLSKFENGKLVPKYMISAEESVYPPLVDITKQPLPSTTK